MTLWPQARVMWKYPFFYPVKESTNLCRMLCFHFGCQFFFFFFKGRQCEIDLSWTLGSISRSFICHFKVKLLSSFVLLLASLGTSIMSWSFFLFSGGGRYNCFTMLCSFLLHNEVNQLCVNIYSPHPATGPTALALDLPTLILLNSSKKNCRGIS